MGPTTPLSVPAKSVRFAAEEIDDTSQGNLLDVTVLGICGDEMAAVHVSEDCTVARLKAAIASQSSVLAAAQELILEACILDDDQSMREVLQESGCVGQTVIALTLVVMPLDPFPKLYIDNVSGVRWTATRAEQTPKREVCANVLADPQPLGTIECKECDGVLQEKARDYDFA